MLANSHIRASSPAGSVDEAWVLTNLPLFENGEVCLPGMTSSPWTMTTVWANAAGDGAEEMGRG
ncbi:unnamed protein product [Protopolystoma xenopodis]|uniref:Uncharacterized protein n=1 Tax=Protopolystoma xenopodis TaxID=117903 RepID=A0A3S5AWT8_9PLAT|nr:unnamed protein product [Protopolystoma xenopodis]